MMAAEMSEQHKPTKKLILMAAILAAVLLAAVFTASQLTATATAQSEAVGLSTGTEGQMTEDQTEATPVSAEVGDDDHRSTLSVTGMASTKTQPDMFSVTVGVETNSTTAQEAASANTDLVNATIAALTDLGIAEEQITTSSYNLFPVYGDMQRDEACIEIFPPPPECQPQQVITGYRASSSLTVTLETEGEVEAGQVIDTAIGAGANNVQGVFFFLSSERQQEVRDGLIAEAIDDARHKADIAAAALEMGVSGIKSVSVDEVHFPILSRGESVQLAATPILPGEQEVTSNVSITYIISSASEAEAETATEAEMEEGLGVESATETENGSEAELETGIEEEGGLEVPKT